MRAVLSRLAIAHEWLSARAGSEKSFEAMAAAFPDADLYALSWDRRIPFEFGGRAVRTTFLDRSARLRGGRALTLPLMPLAWWLRARRHSYETVLTSSHACVKAFPPARSAEHFCYCHAPMRYAWETGIDQRYPTLAKPLLSGALAALRTWDRNASAHVDHFAANSTAVRERIRRTYDRDAAVIAPPVDTHFFTPASAVKDDFALAVSRFIPYKRLDVAIEAAARARHRLVIAGSGPEEANLRRLARDVRADVRFEIAPSDERLRELYRGASVLIFAAHEDFGIIPVEAQACGTPVIGRDVGGTRDTVVEGVTGRRLKDPTVEAYAEAIREAFARPFAAFRCRENAERFSTERFKSQLRSWLTGTGGRNETVMRPNNDHAGGRRD